MPGGGLCNIILSMGGIRGRIFLVRGRVRVCWGRKWEMRSSGTNEYCHHSLGDFLKPDHIHFLLLLYAYRWWWPWCGRVWGRGWGQEECSSRDSGAAAQGDGSCHQWEAANSPQGYWCPTQVWTDGACACEAWPGAMLELHVYVNAFTSSYKHPHTLYYTLLGTSTTLVQAYPFTYTSILLHT